MQTQQGEYRVAHRRLGDAFCAEDPSLFDRSDDSDSDVEILGTGSPRKLKSANANGEGDAAERERSPSLTPPPSVDDAVLTRIRQTVRCVHASLPSPGSSVELNLCCLVSQRGSRPRRGEPARRWEPQPTAGVRQRRLRLQRACSVPSPTTTSTRRTSTTKVQVQVERESRPFEPEGRHHPRQLVRRAGCACFYCEGVSANEAA